MTMERTVAYFINKLRITVGSLVFQFTITSKGGREVK